MVPFVVFAHSKKANPVANVIRATFETINPFLFRIVNNMTFTQCLILFVLAWGLSLLYSTWSILIVTSVIIIGLASIRIVKPKTRFALLLSTFGAPVIVFLEYLVRIILRVYYFWNLSKLSIKYPVTFATRLFTLVYQLHRSRNPADIIVALQAYITSYFYIEDMAEYALPHLSSIAHSLMPDYQAQSSSPDDFLEVWGLLRNSRRLRGVRKALLTILCFPFIGHCKTDVVDFMTDNSLLTKMEEDVPDKLTESSMFNLALQLHWIFKTAIPLVHRGDYRTLLLDDSEYISWSTRYAEWRATREKLRGIDGITAESFLAEGRELARDAKFLNPKVRSSSAFINQNKDVLTLISSVESEFGACRPRAQPFSLLLYGFPGTGKSILAGHLSAMFHMIEDDFLNRDHTFDSSVNIYARNASDTFWSGYDSNIHRTIILDELASEPKQHLRNGPGSHAEIIAVINTVALLTNQASLEDKGKVPIRSSFVIGTTNTKSLNAHLAAEQPAAILRRFPYTITVMRDEFFEASTTNYNSWTFTVENVVPVYDGDSGHIEYRMVAEKIKSAEFFPLMRDIMRKHFESGKHLPPSTFSPTLCSHALPKVLCGTCNPLVPQSGTMGKEEYTYSPSESDYSSDDQSYDETSANWWESFLRSYGSKLGKVGDFIDRYILYKATEFDRQNSSAFESFCMGYERYGISKEAISFGTQFAIQFAIGFAIGTVITFFCAIMTSILSHVISLGKYEAQGSLQSKEKEEKVEIIQSDFWHKAPPRTEMLTAKGKCASYDDVLQIVRRNVRHIVFDDGDGSETFQQALGVFGTTYVTTAHSLKNLTFPLKITVTYTPDFTGIGSKVVSFVQEKQCCFHDSDDLVLIYMPRTQPVRDIRHLFFTKEPSSYGTGDVLLNRRDDQTNLHVSKLTQERVEYTCDGENYQVSCVTYPGKTSKGDCGSPLVMRTGKIGTIYGIHCAGSLNRNKGCALHVPYSFLYSFNIDRNASVGSLETFEAQVACSERIFPRSAILHKSVPKGSCDFHGTRVVTATPKSKVCPTPIAEYCIGEYDMMFKHGPPMMKGRKVGDEWVDPWVNNARKCVEPAHLDFDLQPVAEHYATQIEPLNVFITPPLSLEESLNGIDGVIGVNRIPMSTSAGAPWHTSKSHLVIELEPTVKHAVRYALCPEVKSMYNKMLASASIGERCLPLFVSHLKDEPTALVKCENGKTRVFSGCNFPFSLLVRQYFLPVINSLMSDPLLSEMAVGVNSVSKDWEKFYTYLTFFGRGRLVAGDYEKFDKRMSCEITLKAYHVLIDFAQSSGYYSELDIRIMNSLATDLAYPIIDHHGDIISFYGGNPSGSPLTTILNSVVNSLYIRIAYVRAGNWLATFRNCVHLLTYGDDNAMGIGPTLKPFNHSVIQYELAKLGIVYTMADKQAESRPFIWIEQVSFLKRNFDRVFYRDRFYILSPLEWDSVTKSLLVWLESKSVSPPEQLFGTLSSALRESALHSEQRYTMIRDIISWAGDNVTDFGPWADSIPNKSYDEYRNELIDWIASGDIDSEYELDSE